MKKHYRLTIILLLFILALTIVLHSCDLTLKILNSTDTKHTNKDTDNDDFSENNIKILLIKKDTNIETLLKKTGGVLLDSIEIEQKTYIKVKGITEKVTRSNAVLKIEEEVYRTEHAIPQDTLYSSQYAPQITDLESVWDPANGMGYTGAGVRVAVLDSGVNTLHEDFTDSSGVNTAFDNGYDYNANQEYTPGMHVDRAGHGTKIAGIIAARKNNNKGIVGVAPDSIIIPFKTIDDYLNTHTGFNIASAIKEAVDNRKVKIINMSLGGLKTSSLEADAVQYALKNNVVVVASSGNEAKNFISYPASYPGVISVGATDGTDTVANFSTRSVMLSVVAPGVDIVTLGAGENLGEASTSYGSSSGSSLSAPFVAGLAALLLQKFPLATPAQIKEILENTALDLGTPGFDYEYGYGRVRPKEALATTTLPTTTWHTVNFRVDYEKTALKEYAITIYNTDNIHKYYSTLTNSFGIASLVIPKGNYKYTSAYYGISFSGTLTVVDKDLSITKNFVSTDFNDYYRISTYLKIKPGNTVDTNLTLNQLFADNTIETIFYNDDISSTDYYSQIIFKGYANTEYEIIVGAYYKSFDSGYYQIRIEAGIPTTEPEYITPNNEADYDQTNNDATNKENLVLTVGTPLNGYIDSLAKDKDYFRFSVGN